MRVLSHREIGREVYWLSVADFESKLFESIWPIPRGVNYNAYLVGDGGEYLLIDSAKKFVEARELVELIGRVVDTGKVKHIAVLHTEPDHSGLVAEASSLLGNPVVYLTSKAALLMKRLFGIDTKVLKDDDSLKVGNRLLRVVELPWVHRPDTMFLYLQDEGVLFSSDAFGAFGALEDPRFDSEVDFDLYLESAKKYFATVVAKYRRLVLQDLEKLRKLELNVRTIAPAHGIVLRDRVRDFTQALVSWCELRKTSKVTVVYGSMYGFTELIANFASDQLRYRVQSVVSHDVSNDNVVNILSDVADSAGVLFLVPTYEAEAFPPMVNLVDLIRLKRLGEGKLAAVFLTKLWGSAEVEQMTAKLEAAGFEIYAPAMELVNFPTEEELEGIRGFLKDFCEKFSEGI